MKPTLTLPYAPITSFETIVTSKSPLAKNDKPEAVASGNDKISSIFKSVFFNLNGQTQSIPY